MAEPGFGAAFARTAPAAGQNFLSRRQNQQQFDARLENTREQQRAQQMQKLRTQALNTIAQIGDQLAKIRQNQGQQAVDRELSILAKPQVLRGFAFATGIPEPQIIDNFRRAALVGATGQEAGAREGAQAAAAAPGEARAITTRAPAEAAAANQKRLLSPEVFDQQVALNQAKSANTTVNVKSISEAEGTVNAIEQNRRKFAETGDPKFNRIADKLEMNLMFGGKPPEAFVKARGALGQAREGVARIFTLISEGAGPVLPTDRAKLKQAFSNAKLGIAELTNRGANFTDTEQALIDSVLGGDPTDIVSRIIRGDQSFLEGLRNAGELIDDRGKQLIETFTNPGLPDFKFPWEQDGGPRVIDFNDLPG